MMQDTAFALFDAAALTAPERQLLRQQADCVWGYANIPDEGADEMGPVWVPETHQSSDLAATLWSDPNRWWAASQGISQGDFALLSRHLRRLRYITTHDGQRYFFRFADSRCLSAMASALTKSDRRQNLAGPITSWRYIDHAGKEAVLRYEASEKLSHEIRLREPELATLLDAAWPDQLLSTVMETSTSLPSTVSLTDAHTWARQLCGLFRERDIDSYPVQIEALKLTLTSSGAALSEPGFAETLTQAQGEGSADLIGTFFETRGTGR